MNFLNAFLDSWKILKNKKTLILIGVEFLFFILLTIGALVSVTFITERAQNLQAFQQEFQVDENANPTYLYQNLLLLSQMLDEIIKAAVYFFIFLFLVFGFFMGMQWNASRNLIEKKKLFHDYNLSYLLKFYLSSLIWFLIFAAGFYALYEIGFNYTLFFLLLILLFYFMWVNFSCFNNEKNIFRNFWNGIKISLVKFHVLILAFLIFAAILFAASYLLDFANYGFFSIILSILGVVFFVWFRIFLIRIVDVMEDK